jgi:magnesium-transporting ATPase (P-type)
MNKDKWLIKKGSYIFDRRIFLGFYLFCFVLLFFICFTSAKTYGFKSLYKPEVYVNCNSEYPCLNPFYNKCYSYNCGDECKQFCNQQYLLPGVSYGYKQPDYINKGMFLVISYFIACFVFNHLVFNRSFKFKELEEKVNIENEPNKPN